MRVLALDMGGTFIKYAVCNIDKKMNIKFIEKGRYRTYDGGNVFKEMQVIDNMGKFAKKCIKKYPDIQCVCSSIGGILDVDNYRVLVSATHKYGDPKMHNIKSRFGKYVKLPLYIINDIKAGGLGELRYGALKKHGKTADAVFIGIGTGIAAVTIINGKLHLGKT
jgi:predicted NBD/HSP70 family sugar kinase